MHLETARRDMFKMETKAMKKLKEELKCNEDVESSFGDREIHSEKEGRNRDNNLGKRWKERPIRWKGKREMEVKVGVEWGERTERWSRERHFLDTDLIS